MMEISGKVMVLATGEVRDLGPKQVVVKPGTVLPFREVFPKLEDGEELSGYTDDKGKSEVVRTWDKTTPRCMIRKSLVEQRLRETGKMAEAFALLMTMPDAWTRWYSHDHPDVYADDPEALALLATIGADPDVIMAPEA